MRHSLLDIKVTPNRETLQPTTLLRAEIQLRHRPRRRQCHRHLQLCVPLVLNNCRALQGLHEGKITSKREGAKWAKQHLDAQWHALIDYCWQERQDTGINVSQPADPRAFQHTVAFIADTTRLAEEYQLPKD